ncbi:DMT family transporter [Terrarubrum flagellatum]|uniref:DMT family transporter n=1 Tax=Terrirubrum flagellatum TaxID=2895980 RepID=UPI00314554C3
MNPLFGISLKVLSTLVFAFMGAGVKTLTVRYPIGEVVFCRSFFAMIPLGIWLWWIGQWPGALRTKRPLGHIQRGVMGSIGMFLGFAGLSYLPLPDQTALGYTAPLLVVALAALIIGETVRIYRWSAVAIGFVGVIVMLAPQLSALSGGVLRDGATIGAAFTLASALCNAFSTIEVRKLVQMEEKTGTIVFWIMSMTTILGFCTIVLGWRAPDLTDAAIMVGMGIVGGLGQIFVTESYQHAETSLIAPFDYTSMIWAVMIGWFLFGDWPAANIFIGSAIVISAGIFVIWREHQLGLERKRQRQATSSKML